MDMHSLDVCFAHESVILNLFAKNKIYVQLYICYFQSEIESFVLAVQVFNLFFFFIFLLKSAQAQCLLGGCHCFSCWLSFFAEQS